MSPTLSPALSGPVPPTLDNQPTMAARLAWLAHRRPGDRALVQVDAEGDTPFSYAQLHERAGRVAAVLAAHAGERVLLLLDSGVDYVAAFFGCLYAGAIAVPAFPPESAREQHLARLRSIASDARATVVLTSSVVLDKLGDAIAAIAMASGGAAVIAVDTLAQQAAGFAADFALSGASLRGETVAFLQYTSGSTSAPKGVIVTNANLWANEVAIQAGLGVAGQDVFVSWLPLFHDMGLIGGLLQPVFSGIPLVLMSPQFFLERPVRWLDAIARHRGTISGGPDFAYRLCCERVRESQAADLDLSSWRVAFSGSEPVRRDTLDAFIERFAPHGFASSAVYPCYGLAEATLFVTGVVRGAGMHVARFESAQLARGIAAPVPADAEDEGTPLVGCGATVAAHAVRLVGDDGQTALPDGRVGEIWACGPSIAQGYWNNAAASEAAFVTRDGERWLRTGDLGFRARGQLFVVGRKKDMIIVRGQNLFPEDIERAVERDIDLVRKGRICAFGAERDGREGIGLAVEISRGTQKLVEPAKIVAALNEAVALACGEPLAVVVLLNPGALPKTSSGKLQRAATRAGWREHTLDAWVVSEQGRLVVADGAGSGAENGASTPGALPDGAIEQQLAAIWQDVLGGASPRRDDSFLALGGNSLAAVQVVSRVRETWGVPYDAISLFTHPRLDASAAAIAALLGGTGADKRGSAPIARRDADALPESSALSYAQQRQWFLWHLDRASTAYHVDGALMLRGTLNIAALRGSFNAIVARHEALRTTFHATASGDAQQRIAADAHYAYAFANLSEEADRESAARAWARTFAAQPFDLTTGPLLRVGVARAADDEHLLVVAMHHIVSDGWSMGVLLREFVEGYRARVNDEAITQPELPIQYADYAVWQRRWLAEGEQERQLAYWRATLGGGEQPVLALPVDRPRQAVGAYRAASERIALSASLADALHRVARERNATPFMVLLTAFDALLHRYTGETDIRIGVPVASRNRVETEGLIGFFVNTQVLKAELDGRTTLAALLDQVKARALDAQAHQDLPFDVLVDALQPERSLSHTPLFQVMFNHRRDDLRVLDALPGLTVAREELGGGAAQFELSLQTDEAPDGAIAATLSYASELFDAETMARFGRHYVRVLEALTGDLNRSIDAIELLDAQECNDLLAWGSNDAARPNALPVHERIHAQAEATPDAIAVVCGEASLSYADLEARANALAHRLIALDVKPETRVGIALERSLDMIVGLVAILKAGGAYVPLDPAYPRDRLAYMIEDSGIALLLTHAHVRDTLPVPASLNVLELDTLDLSAGPHDAPAMHVEGANLAYVIYTSGSTGQPKGVAVAHAALATHCAAIGARYALTPADRLLQFASISFDAAQEQWLIPLLAGATIVLRDGDLWSAPRLARAIREQRISVLYLPPAYIDEFAASIGDGEAAVRTCIVGGEAWPRSGFEAVRDKLRAQRIFNAYGPAETVITPTVWEAGAGTRIGTAYAPVGHVVGARRAYVLDAALNLAPRGVTGELYLGGSAVARGYLNRASLTAQRFVPDPFGGDGERLYRTGDLVRWNAEGELEYIGRIDHQVKIRGFRVEPGEIEAALLAQPGVREAVVMALAGAGGARLVAWVTAAGHAAPDVDALRTALARTLPDYMLPAAIVVLDALPLNPNGKVDRKALPKVEAQVATHYEAPQGDDERALAEIWRDVLGVARVGRHDNFFELGGDSILSIKVVARAEAAGLPLSPRQLFERQTVASLAQVLRAPTPLADRAPGAPQPPLVATARDGALPLSYAQQRLWFLWNLQPDSTAYHIAGGLVINGRIDVEALRASFAAVVARHESLRTTFAEQVDGSARQVVHAWLDYGYAWADFSAQADAREAARSFAAELAQEPFDLMAGPLLKIGVARVADDEHWVAISMHHIVSDGWSIDVLLDDLRAAWCARLSGLNGLSGLSDDMQPLPPLALQYADYACWQRALLDAGERERQLRYWTDHLGRDAQVLSLPADRPRRALGNYRARSHAIALPRGIGERVRRCAQRAGATPFMVLLAAFDALLYRHSGQPDIRVGVPVANRERSEVAPLIGFFVNTQVLKAQLDGITTLAALLDQVKTNALGAQAHQDLPFDVLVDALQPERSLSHTPLFQVMFNHQKDEGRGLGQWPGLAVRLFAAEGGAAQFELKLDTVERADGEWSATLTYADELFDAGTIDRLGRHYVTMLERMIDEPAVRIGDVVLLDGVDRDALLELSRVDERYEERRPVHCVIAGQARATPDAVALEFGERALSYRELDTQANRLAHRLIALGVGPEVRVGIAVERSVEMVVGLLAILKAGGAYVPLDPEYPRERLAYMIEDSGIALLLTQARVRDALPVPASLDVLELDTLDLSMEPATDPAVPVDVENLAYVIYTSGSTGRPKGAANRHGALTNRLVWMQQAYGIDASDTVLQKTPFSFDVSVWEFFWPLMVGAKLAVAQ
ncbi:non-ribosomal peptide synthetase, partial [Paraburkholderia sp. J63]|uniref:non-ribosomal peptide synthetase n=1 Tax=Paraburkholderia sp. J63 TaxID=2805434 RepID=UPI002ABD622A